MPIEIHGLSDPGHKVGVMKFLHTADWQLGMTRSFLDPEAQARYSAARRDAVAALGRWPGRQVRSSWWCPATSSTPTNWHLG